MSLQEVIESVEKKLICDAYQKSGSSVKVAKALNIIFISTFQAVSIFERILLERQSSSGLPTKSQMKKIRWKM
ncbi:MAG: hypothetical protein ACOX4S_03935 [Anaerovoracaceae bacterium]|jgi:hypothetical protein